jgi:hypothetical protein
MDNKTHNNQLGGYIRQGADNTNLVIRVTSSGKIRILNKN